MKAQAFNSKLINHSNAALIIKKYIDDNFSDAQFSIGRIGNELNYNKKYISTLFKKEFNIGIIDYLTLSIFPKFSKAKWGYLQRNT